MVGNGLTSKENKMQFYMYKLYKKKKLNIMIISIIFLFVLAVGFFYQFEVDYSDYKRIERLDGEGFYPDAYAIFHSENEFQKSAVYENHGNKIIHAINLDFKQYSYVIVYGAKVKRMYYSVKSTIFDDKSPYYCSAVRNKMLCLFIEYQVPDNYMYIYQIDKNNMLKTFGGI